jgi:hypothetical protein
MWHEWGRGGVHIGYWWENQTPLRRLRRKSVNNINMNLRNIGWDGLKWIDVAQHREQWRALVNTVMNLRVPLNSGNFLSTCRIGGFSRRPQIHD